MNLLGTLLSTLWPLLHVRLLSVVFPQKQSKMPPRKCAFFIFDEWGVAPTLVPLGWGWWVEKINKKLIFNSFLGKLLRPPPKTNDLDHWWRQEKNKQINKRLYPHHQTFKRLKGFLSHNNFQHVKTIGSDCALHHIFNGFPLWLKNHA